LYVFFPISLYCSALDANKDTYKTRSLAVAKRPCDCCVTQFWQTVADRRYFADIIGLSSTTMTWSASKAVEFRESHCSFSPFTRDYCFHFHFTVSWQIWECMTV